MFDCLFIICAQIRFFFADVQNDIAMPYRYLVVDNQIRRFQCNSDGRWPGVGHIHSILLAAVYLYIYIFIYFDIRSLCALAVNWRRRWARRSTRPSSLGTRENDTTHGEMLGSVRVCVLSALWLTACGLTRASRATCRTTGERRRSMSMWYILLHGRGNLLTSSAAPALPSSSLYQLEIMLINIVLYVMYSEHWAWAICVLPWASGSNDAGSVYSIVV